MDAIFDSLMSSGASFSRIAPATILLSLLLSAIVGQLIGWIYMWTHVSPSYSKSFSTSLVTLPVIVALMMLLMADNTAIAFGLLAVFAVVRFRNVLKDTRDTTFILWAIVEGLGIGTMHFFESLCGLAVVGLLVVYLRVSDFGGRNRYDAFLSLDYEGSNIEERLASVFGRHTMRWKRQSEQSFENTTASASFRVLLRDPSRCEEFREDLLRLESVQQISLYVNAQNSEL